MKDAYDYLYEEKKAEEEEAAEMDRMRREEGGGRNQEMKLRPNSVLDGTKKGNMNKKLPREKERKRLHLRQRKKQLKRKRNEHKKKLPPDEPGKNETRGGCCRQKSQRR